MGIWVAFNKLSDLHPIKIAKDEVGNRFIILLLGSIKNKKWTLAIAISILGVIVNNLCSFICNLMKTANCQQLCTSLQLQLKSFGRIILQIMHCGALITAGWTQTSFIACSKITLLKGLSILDRYHS